MTARRGLRKVHGLKASDFSDAPEMSHHRDSNAEVGGASVARRERITPTEVKSQDRYRVTCSMTHNAGFPIHGASTHAKYSQAN